MDHISKKYGHSPWSWYWNAQSRTEGYHQVGVNLGRHVGMGDIPVKIPWADHFPYMKYTWLVPQVGIAKLVNISTITFGLMNGGYIELVFRGIINQRSHHWGAPPCRLYWQGVKPFSSTSGWFNSIMWTHHTHTQVPMVDILTEPPTPKKGLHRLSTRIVNTM